MVVGGGGCNGQRLALAHIEMELRAEQSLSIIPIKGMPNHGKRSGLLCQIVNC